MVLSESSTLDIHGVATLIQLVLLFHVKPLFTTNDRRVSLHTLSLERILLSLEALLYPVGVVGPSSRTSDTLRINIVRSHVVLAEVQLARRECLLSLVLGMLIIAQECLLRVHAFVSASLSLDSRFMLLVRKESARHLRIVCQVSVLTGLLLKRHLLLHISI